MTLAEEDHPSPPNMRLPFTSLPSLRLTEPLLMRLTLMAGSSAPPAAPWYSQNSNVEWPAKLPPGPVNAVAPPPGRTLHLATPPLRPAAWVVLDDRHACCFGRQPLLLIKSQPGLCPTHTIYVSLTALIPHPWQ